MAKDERAARGARRQRHWVLALPKAEDTPAHALLLEFDQGLGRSAARGSSPTAARFRERLRLWTALATTDDAKRATALVALDLSLHLQELAAEILDADDVAAITALRKHVVTLWAAAHEV